MFRYRLISSGGEDIGPLVSNESTWKPGSRVQRNHGDALLVQAVVAAEDGAGFTAYLVVESARAGASHASTASR